MQNELFLELIPRIHPFTLTRALDDTCRFVRGGMKDCEPDDVKRFAALWDATEELMAATCALDEDDAHRVEAWYAALQHYVDVFAQRFTPYCDFNKPGHGQMYEYDKVVILLSLMICRGLGKSLVDVSQRWSGEDTWATEGEAS